MTERPSRNMLVLEEASKPTAQYIYLPAFKKTRRIAARQSSEAFLGSDFTYGDLDRQHLILRYHQIMRFDAALARIRVYCVLPPTSARS